MYRSNLKRVLSVMKLINVILLLIAFSSNTLLSETYGRIQGQVTDSRTKEPLAGVNVLVVGYTLGASTDLDGYYNIDKITTGTQRIEFSYVGYETRIVSDIMVLSSKPATVNTKLSESLIEVETIVVTGGYFPEETQIQSSTIALNREEIRRFPGGFEDVVRTVSTLPGVTITGSNARNDLLVRGGGPSENLFIVNNIEVPNINHFGTQGFSSGSLSFINLDFVDNVSFSTGGFTARYGEKMSSVLELELTEGRTDRLGFKTLISATQFGFNSEGPLGENGNFIFSARKSYLDLIFKAAGLPFVPVYNDLNFLANYKLSSKDRISVIGLAALDYVDRDQSTLENRVSNAGLLDNTQNQYIFGLDYRHLFQKGYFEVTANYNLMQYDFTQVDSAEQPYFQSQNDEGEAGLKIKYFRALNKRLSIISGISQKFIRNTNDIRFADVIYNRSGVLVPRASFGLPSRNTETFSSGKSAGFIETDYNFNKRFSLNGGVRLDHYNFLSEKDYLAPRIALRYQLSGKTSMKLSGGTYYQSPSYVWLINPANRNLKALKNDMAVLGVDYLWRSDTRLSLEVYYKDYTNLPTGSQPDINDYFVITNSGTDYGGRNDDFQSFGYYSMNSTGKGQTYGMEWLLQKRFSDIPFYGQISFSLSHSEFIPANGEKHEGPFDQPYLLNISAGYIFNEKWEISGKFRYFSGLPYTPVYLPSENPSGIYSIQNLPDEYLSDRLSSGHHLDVRIDRYFNFQKWTLITFLDIQNIYNFQIEQRPQFDFWNDEIIRYSKIGILPSIGISFEF